MWPWPNCSENGKVVQHYTRLSEEVVNAVTDPEQEMDQGPQGVYDDREQEPRKQAHDGFEDFENEHG